MGDGAKRPLTFIRGLVMAGSIRGCFHHAVIPDKGEGPDPESSLLAGQTLSRSLAGHGACADARPGRQTARALREQDRRTSAGMTTKVGKCVPPPYSNH